MINKFRLDLNGLRAVAVAAVLLFHFNILPFTGGFVGVDVFFVLSGFLMTHIIGSGLDKCGFGFFSFYLNRLARIFPALLIVVLSSLALGYFLLLPAQYSQLAIETVEALTFTVNFHYATNTGYFAPNAAQSWLLHCWSLAVEFQFYILFPVYLWIARRMAPKNGILTALGIAIIGSMICSVIQSEMNQMSAFYLLPSRAWEFAIGGLVLFLPAPSERYRNPIATTGLVAIVAAALLFDGHLKYPSLWSVVPVLGAGAVVWAGSTLYALRNPLAQFAGKISYSLYLWHWPILTVARYLGYGSTPLEVLILIILTIAISWASFVFIETPFRSVFRKPSVHSISPLAIAASLAVAGCAVTIATDGWPSRISDRMIGIQQQVTQGQEYRGGICFLGAEQKFSDFDRKCLDPEPHSPKPTLVIWGDSYAAHLYSGIAKQSWAAKFKIVQVTASACLPLPMTVSVDRPNCQSIQKSVRELLGKSKPQILVLAASWRGTGADSAQKLVRSLIQDGVGRVLVVGPIPYWPLPLPQTFFRDSLLKEDRWSERSSIPDAYVSALTDTDQQYSAAISTTGASYVSLYDALCKGDNCLALIPGWQAESLFQFDGEHLTADGSEWVAEHVIGPALGWPAQKAPFVALDQIIEFHDKAVGKKYLTSGWMPAEGWGAWTASPQRPGTINLLIDPAQPPLSVKVKFWGQLGPTFTAEHFVIKFDGDNPVETKVTQANPVVEQVFLLGEGARNKMTELGRLRIEFRAPDGKSPKEMGLNNDERVLGLGIRELTLQH